MRFWEAGAQLEKCPPPSHWAPPGVQTGEANKKIRHISGNNYWKES